MLVKITKCSNIDAIGFIGQLTTAEVWSKKTCPWSWRELYNDIQPNQICIVGEKKSFISDPNGFVEIKYLE